MSLGESEGSCGRQKEWEVSHSDLQYRTVQLSAVVVWEVGFEYTDTHNHNPIRIICIRARDSMPER